MHIGIQVTPHEFTLLTSVADQPTEVISRLSFSADNLSQAIENLAVSLPSQASSVMLNLPAAWSWYTRALVQKTLQAVIPEVLLVPTPIVLLHALQDKKVQDIFWWEPWEKAIAFGYISLLPGKKFILEAYQTGSRQDCLSAALAHEYYQQDSWSVELCLRPNKEQAALNLLPVKLETWIYEEQVLHDGLTRYASLTKDCLNALKLAGSPSLQIMSASQTGPAHPLTAINGHLEYPYQELSLHADVSGFPFTDSQPVHITELASQLPLWSGTAAELKEACLWIHPAIGHVEVIKNNLHFLPRQIYQHPEGLLESRLVVPLPANPSDVQASLQLMLHHLENQ